MRIENVLLKKEELPVKRVNPTGGDYYFNMPIHPELLREDIYITVSADDYFLQAVEDTIKEVGSARKSHYDIFLLDNGFAKELMLNEHVGLIWYLGSAYPLPREFSEEKWREYSNLADGATYLHDGAPPYGYNTKNLSSKTDATLLRNWAVLYLNAALSEIWDHK